MITASTTQNPFHDLTPSVIIKGLLFKRTCIACPEQYDVYDGRGRIVGYVRLRHGELTATKKRNRADYGEEIYRRHFSEDGPNAGGIFPTEGDREKYLTKVAKLFKAKIR